jgi:hypothetical protein
MYPRSKHLMMVSDQFHALAASSPEKHPQYPIDIRLILP